jgi:hypothetical protein
LIDGNGTPGCFAIHRVRSVLNVAFVCFQFGKSLLEIRDNEWVGHVRSEDLPQHAETHALQTVLLQIRQIALRNVTGGTRSGRIIRIGTGDYAQQDRHVRHRTAHRACGVARAVERHDACP